MTAGEAFRSARERLSRAGVENAQNDAWLLMERAFSLSLASFLADQGMECDEGRLADYEDLVRRRAERIPLQHLLGTWEFMGLPFLVSEDALIPRQDTEILAEEVEKVARGASVLDLCTGSGCVILSLWKRLPLREAMGSDISGAALRVARENAKALGADVPFVESDLFERIEGRFDVIVANPPYIESGKIGTLAPEVRDHEPRIALDGGKDGLAILERIISEAPGHLREGGWLLLEMGCGQGKAVLELMRREGFRKIRVARDLAGHDRVAIGRAS